MSFDIAFARTIGIEGGYSNNPNDPGGETNWGITIATARTYGYQGPMKDMTKETARDIYRTGWWNLLHLGDVDAINQLVAEELFDIAVNCGPAVPGPYLQRALNIFNRQGKDYPDIPVDGLMGGRTVAALKSFFQVRGAAGERVLLSALLVQLGMRYIQIAESRPQSEDFEFGWFANRVAGAL